MSAANQAWTQQQRVALTRAISPDRLQTYQTAASRTSADVLDVYLWDRDVAAAVLADIAILEVALRNALHTALKTMAGSPEWYKQDIGLDDRSLRAVTQAWNSLPATRRTEGRVVAQLMFGFWKNLLESGGTAGDGPLRRQCDYETIWRKGLSTAFPGGKVVANVERARFTRHWTLQTVGVVHSMRNRAAHHEPLVGGFPLPGQKDKQGNPVRRTTRQGHDECLKLAALLDRDLVSWLRASSQVPNLLTRYPAL